VRLLKPCNLRRGNGLTTIFVSRCGEWKRDYAAIARAGENRGRHRRDSFKQRSPAAKRTQLPQGASSP